ncbi:hypothetical protein ASPACDRAFT_37080 [Aspergillus aculeatus ATCC 16872]|uniref:Major facilitator superfamily (MFS) profile domain-containing protein n=1 Tax=Aspergillus aculeatus (strain ATCC 16872 / CBS 172.66 / WB 5094) TaxID=690307 RepID=A0A1L9WFH2_ASPA1|nr:uncharacterized protein ASPACDRAFT_37080 [Aspergillus aculeatus ATCC 16872]OJJ94932.1 hypothetical protein ASPACDRAFT_37080 [Aspergillus aculeatus ATCC 16872]
MQDEGATPALEKWNASSRNITRVVAVCWSFLIVGMSDGAVGALIPYLKTYYRLSETIVSLIFLSPVVGYVLAALASHNLHTRFGQRGTAFLAPVCHIASYVVNCLHPPFPVVVVAFIFTGVGNGLEESAWNAWLGNMAKANELLGILHGVYGAGALMGPLIATSLITKAHFLWWEYYYIMIGLAATEFAACMAAFWGADGSQFRAATFQSRESDTNTRTDLRIALSRRPYARITWLCAIFLLGYVGIEVSLGGWIVTFMAQVRHGSAFASGLTATGFWLGITLGRLLLGFITPRIGEALAIMIYVSLTIVFCLVFWLVPNFYASAVAVAVQGFFLGPLFPAAVVTLTRVLPRKLHLIGIGFAAAVGSGGAAILPFVFGVVAQSAGVQVLEPFILVLSVAILLLWIGLPGIFKKHRE